YELYAVVRDQGDAWALSRVPLDVRQQDVADIRIGLHSGVEIKGTITVDGAPAAKGVARVWLQPDGTMGKLGLAPPDVSVDETGGFSVPAVAEGHFHVSVLAASPGLYVDEVRQNNLDIYDTGFDVGADPPMPLHVILKSGAGSLEGTTSPGAI